MPVFNVTGDVDPFLHVSLAKGEKIYCESNAMVMMETNLELKGKMTGGIGAALMRTFANGESFFQQHIEAMRGDGDCLLSPTLPGAMSILEVTPGKDVVIDNAHVVCWDKRLQYEISITTGSSGGFLGNLINSQTSGEGMVLKFSGTGKILVCSRNRAAFLAWTQSKPA